MESERKLPRDPDAEYPCEVCGAIECRCGATRYGKPFLTPDELEEMDPEEIEAWQEAHGIDQGEADERAT